VTSERWTAPGRGVVASLMGPRLPRSCVSSGTDWAKVGVTGVTAQVTHGGYNWTRRVPSIAEALRSREVTSAGVDGAARDPQPQRRRRLRPAHAALARSAPQKPARALQQNLWAPRRSRQARLLRASRKLVLKPENRGRRKAKARTDPNGEPRPMMRRSAMLRHTRYKSATQIVPERNQADI
jgi:hypothetical protein